MKVRLEQIAARAGVSISTVSRVLNEKPGVSPSTRRVVLTALDVLGYERPARLRPRTSGLMGLIVPELENPFFPRLAGQLEIDLARVGYTAVLCSQSLGGVHEDDFTVALTDLPALYQEIHKLRDRRIAFSGLHLRENCVSREKVSERHSIAMK